MSHATRIAMLVIASAALAGCATRPGCFSPSDPVCSAPYAVVGPADPAVTGSLTPLQRVDVAPDVLAAQARVNAANDEIAKAQALGMPTAALAASGGGSVERDAGYSGTYAGGIYSYALGVDIPLYQGGRTEAAVLAAQAEFRASEEALTDKRIATAYELALALLRISQERQLIAALDRQQGLLAQLRRELASEMAVGAASRVDLDDIDRQIARIRVLSEQARITISQVEQVARRLGVPTASRLPDASTLGLVEDPRALVALAVRNNPRIRERAAMAEAAQARITQAQGELLPTVSAGLRVAGEGGSLPSIDITNDARAELRLRMPFDISGGQAANISQKGHEKVAADLERIAAQDGVTAAVHAAVERRRQARRMMGLAQDERRAAQAMLEGVRSERKVGERSTFDEIRSIENLTAAEVNLNSAGFDLRAAEYTLAAETGLITRLMSMPLAVEPPAAVVKAPMAQAAPAMPVRTATAGHGKPAAAAAVPARTPPEPAPKPSAEPAVAAIETAMLRASVPPSLGDDRLRATTAASDDLKLR